MNATLAAEAAMQASFFELEPREISRFWSKVDRSAGFFGCWFWRGADFSRNGYGRFYVIRAGARIRMQAHRIAYEITVGSIPVGLQLDHLCRVRHCVNPAHLEPVDSRENTLRGHSPAIQVYLSGTCSRGHPKTPEHGTPRTDGHGVWRCQECVRMRKSGAPVSAASDFRP